MALPDFRACWTGKSQRNRLGLCAGISHCAWYCLGHCWWFAPSTWQIHYLGNSGGCSCYDLCISPKWALKRQYREPFCLAVPWEYQVWYVSFRTALSSVRCSDELGIFDHGQLYILVSDEQIISPIKYEGVSEYNLTPICTGCHFKGSGNCCFVKCCYIWQMVPTPIPACFYKATRTISHEEGTF